jgi:hypothetical protein
LYKAVSGFNISPFGPGGLSKLLVYAVWGINALLFLSKDIDFKSENYSPGSCSYETQCTVLKKIAETDLYIGNFTLLKVSPIVLIFPCDYELPLFDVITFPKDRSPPSLFFS